MNVEVSQGKTGEVDYPNSISSGALWPCIAIGLLDKSQKRAYLIHEANPMVDQNLPSFLEYVLKKSNKENIIGWVTGAAILKGETKAEIEYLNENKFYVKEVIRNTFDSKSVKIIWAPKNTPVELVIDTIKGKHKILRYN